MADAALDDLLEAARHGNAIGWWAERRREATVITSEAGDRTWTELDANSARLVRALRARGVGIDAAVALMCANRPEFAEVFVATQRMGARLTTVNWHLTGDEAGYIVDDCEAEAFFADARFAEAAVAAATLATRATVRISIGGEIAGFTPYEELLAEGSPEPITDSVLGTTMLYTSGTTGRPKGVFKDRSAIETQMVTAVVAASGYRPHEHRHLCTGPLYHAAPLSLSLTSPLVGGVGIVLMDGWDANETLALIERHRITHTHMVPTMFHRLLALPEEERSAADVSSLRYVLHGAAPCPVEVKQAMIDWWGPIIHEYYAATEGAGSIVMGPDWVKRPGTVGKPATDDHVSIRDESGRVLPVGTPGTIWLKAPEDGRFAYYKDADKTDDSYDGDYFTLGDVGYLDEDGYLFLTDRSAHLIISGGVNIYPAETEAVLLGHPAVGDVAVIGIPSTSDLGEDVLAIVEPRAGTDPDPALADELVAYCRAHLAHYKCPRHVEFTDRLPRADTGKLAKHRLREEYRERFAADS